MPRTVLAHEDSTLRLGISRNLIVSAWVGTPTPEHIRIVGRSLGAVAGRYQEHRASLNLVVTTMSPRFTDAVRDEMVKLLRDARLQGQGTAHVVAMGGLAGTTMRTFLSTVMLLARPSVPSKVFGEVAGAAAWLAPLLATGREAWSAVNVLEVAADVTGKPIETTR